jgi:hypothetical protein
MEGGGGGREGGREGERLREDNSRTRKTFLFSSEGRGGERKEPVKSSEGTRTRTECTRIETEE